MDYEKVSKIIPQPGKHGIFSSGFDYGVFGIWTAKFGDNCDPNDWASSYLEEDQFIPCPFEVSLQEWGERLVDFKLIDNEWWWVKKK